MSSGRIASAWARSRRLTSSRNSLELGRRRRRLDHELAGELADVGRARGVVDEAAALADLVHQWRAHAFAEQRSGDDGRVVVLAQRGNRVAEDDVRLAVAGLHARGDAAGVGRPLDDVLVPGRHRAERALGRGDDLVDVDPAGDADDDVRARVLLPDVAEQLVARDALHRQARADHRLRERMRAVAELVEELVGDREDVFLVLGELVQDHLALALELALGKARVLDDVAEHGDEARRVARHAAHVVRGVVLVGVRVDVGTEPLGVEVDLLAAPRVRALERHVLDEVADAVQALGLVAAAGAHEHADVDALQVREPDRDDANAVGERRDRRVGIDARRRPAPLTRRLDAGADGREQVGERVDVDRLDEVMVEAGLVRAAAIVVAAPARERDQQQLARPATRGAGASRPRGRSGAACRCRGRRCAGASPRPPATPRRRRRRRPCRSPSGRASPPCCRRCRGCRRRRERESARRCSCCRCSARRAPAGGRETSCRECGPAAAGRRVEPRDAGRRLGDRRRAVFLLPRCHRCRAAFCGSHYRGRRQTPLQGQGVGKRRRRVRRRPTMPLGK